MVNGIKLSFLDSLRFMLNSIRKLANNWTSSKFKHAKSTFPNSELFELARRKGVFPYEYNSDVTRLDEI